MMKAIRDKKIRLTILELLKSVYPGALDHKALMFALDNLGYVMPETEVGAHLQYLEQKGYAFTEQKTGPGYQVRFSCLTVEGFELLADDPDLNLGKGDKDMSEGKTCQYIVGLDGSGGHVIAAAIVTADHGDDCCNLTVFPDNGIAAYVSAEGFSKQELENGMARRTSVFKGETPGCWRHIPIDESMFTTLEQTEETSAAGSENIADNGGEASGPGQDAA